MNAHKKVMRIGRLGPWHRRLSYLGLGACAASGVTWFALLDIVGLQPPRVVLWWILHGVTSFVALLAIGAALPTHVPAAWRHFRNRILGGATLALLAVIVVSTVLLLYGQEEWHTGAHWVHVGAGLVALVVFSLHAWFGRRSAGRVAEPARQVKPH